MKEIPLTRGMVALVDDEDFDFASQWQWHASESTTGRFYARRDAVIEGARKRIYLHRALVGAADRVGVDHRNRNTLDDRRTNLRVATQVQNMGNVGMQKHNTSGFKGVTWDKSRERWIVVMAGEGQKTRFIGRFDSAMDAARAYDAAAFNKYGEFAMTNQQMGLLT